jgi:hypothetical protein
MKAVFLLYIAAFVSMAIGWVANIVQIVHMIHEPVTTELVIRIVGVFAAPVGSVLGWCGMFGLFGL